MASGRGLSSRLCSPWAKELPRLSLLTQCTPGTVGQHNMHVTCARVPHAFDMATRCPGCSHQLHLATWHESHGRYSTGLQVCNRGKVACLVSFARAAQQLAQYAVEVNPAGDVTIPPRDVLDMTFIYRCGHCTSIPFIGPAFSQTTGRPC